LLVIALSSLVAVGEWFPSHLAGALDGTVRGGDISDYAGAVVVTLVLIPALIWIGVQGFDRREL